MLFGYLVTLGDGSLDTGDVISGNPISFDSATFLGPGDWVWTGTVFGAPYVNEQEPGEYHLGTDGNVYFVPDFGTVDDLQSASALNPPPYGDTGGVVEGTSGDDVMPLEYTDGDGDQITTGDDTISAGAGNDTVTGAAGDDSISGDEGDDLLFGEIGSDSIDGGAGNDIIYGDSEGIAGRVAFAWSAIPDPDDGGIIDDGDTLAASTTLNVSGVGVTYTYEADPTGYTDGTGGTDTAPVFDTAATYQDGIDSGNQSIDPTSNIKFGGDFATSLIALDFDQGVENVAFRINDIDAKVPTGPEDPLFLDRVTVYAYDDLGARIPVTLTLGGNLTVDDRDGDGSTDGAVSDGTATSGLDPDASILVEIAGPVSRIEIVYEDPAEAGADGLIQVGDIWFDAPPIPGAGNDTLAGGDGDDQIFGEDGDDSLLGGDGFDRLYGGKGVDIMDGGLLADTLWGGEGGDTLFGGDDIDTLYGEEGSDSLSGGFGQDSLFGGLGFDTLEGGDGNDTLDGGDGSDVLYGGAGDDVLDGGEELSVGDDDTLYGGEGHDTLIESETSDTSNDVMYGDAGNDTLSSNAGTDTLFGGADRDSFIVGSASGSDVIAGGETGDDFDTLDATAIGTGVTVDLTANEAGTLQHDGETTTFSEIEAVQTGAGNDTVDASGTTAAMSLDVGGGDDSVAGSEAIDAIYGGDGADTIDGGGGNDFISLGAGSDTVVLRDGGGTDTVTGFTAPTPNGDGTFTATDRVDVSGLTDAMGYPVNVNDVTVTDDGTGNAVLGFPNGESLILFGVAPAAVDDHAALFAMGIPVPDGTVSGTAGDDTIDLSYLGDPDGDRVDAGDALIAGHGPNDDLIEAGTGNDSVAAGIGDDTVYGGTGNDTLSGGVGADTLYGEDGDDTFTLGDGFGTDTLIGGETAEMSGDRLDASAVTQGVTLDLSAGDPASAEDGTLTTGANVATFSEIEAVTLGSGDDSVIGSTGADTVTTGAGADTIDGGAGDDIFDLSADGNADRIILQDGFGSDTLMGFDAPTPNGDGTFSGTDTFDVTALTDAGGNPINTHDVTVTDDGSGNAVLTFPGGESVTLIGVAPATVDDPHALNAMGVPLPDGTVSGTAGSDVIDAAYLGDPDGDRVDADDAVILGDAANDDLIEAGAGDDTIASGVGDDTIFGGTGQDVFYTGAGDDTAFGEDGDDYFLISDGFGNDSVDGGAFGQVSGDFLDATGVTQNLTLDLSTGSPDDPETGTLTDGTNTVSFTEIEGVVMGSGDDIAIGSSGADTIAGFTGSDTINAGAGDDAIDLTDGTFLPDGDADTVVLQNGSGADTIYGFEIPTDNGDGTFTGNDVFDVSSLTDNQGNPVTTTDVTVTDDGAGNALLTFPSGASVTLIGVSPLSVNNPFVLNAMGVPIADGTVAGTAGDDVIDVNYIGDPDGDRIDSADALIQGDGPNVDEVVAGDGNDTVTAGQGGDRVYGGDGNDTVFGGSGDDLVYGGLGDDSLHGDAGRDEIYGDAGNDFLSSGAGQDSLFGGDGNDTFDLGSGTNTADGGTGDDIFNAGAWDDDMFGGDGTDQFVILDGFGRDTAQGGESLGDRDFIDGSGLATATNVTFSGAEAGQIDQGASRLTFTEIEAIATGSAGDTVTGNAGDVTIFTNAGADDIDVDLGDQIIDAGADNDIVRSGAGNDSVDAGSGDDSVFGGSGEDTLSGGDGVDYLSGGSGNDTLFGGDGDDDFNDGSGNDTVYGGAGNDTATISSGFDFIDLGAGNDILEVRGAFFDDVVVGGDEGGDLDRLWAVQLTNGVTIDFTAAEAGVMTSTFDRVTFSEFEDYWTTNYDDTITGDAGDVTITTLSGNDTIATGAGNQSIDAGAGNDSIDAGAGDDTIIASSGNDTIIGGLGADSIAAGSGNDAVTFSDGDTITGASGDDTFTYENLGEATNGTINIDGGSTGETATDGDPSTADGGDTLILGDAADFSTLNAVDDGTGSFSGSISMDDGTLLTFSEIENIICFTPGTLIATPQGARDIADLCVGDMVVTRDHGLQPIRWIDSRTVPAVDKFAPVRIRPGVVTGLERDIVVSPQHRMLFQGFRAELLFGESEVLAAAKHLIDGVDVTQVETDEVTYFHMMFDQHEIVFAEGAATESFHPGDLAITAISDPAREELFAIFPELRSHLGAYGQTARRCLKRHEAELLLV